MNVVLHLLTSREALLVSPAKRRALEKLSHPTQPPRTQREIAAVSLPAGCWHTSAPEPRAAVGRGCCQEPLVQKATYHQQDFVPDHKETEGVTVCVQSTPGGLLQVAVMHSSTMERNHLATN